MGLAENAVYRPTSKMNAPLMPFNSLRDSLVRALSTGLLVASAWAVPSPDARAKTVANTAAPIASQPVAAGAAANASANASTNASTNPAARPAPMDGTAVVVPLSRLVGNDRPLRLSSVAASTRFVLPMPALLRAQAARLELVGTASIALLESSQLEVAVNGRVVQQFRLDGRGQAFRHDAVIPVAALHEGFNDVQISVVQHYADRCEYPMAPQLWTELDLANSRFVLNVLPVPVPLRLDRLDALFDKAVFDEVPPVSVLTSAPPQGAVLSAMGLVAQGIGQRFDFVPVRIASGRVPTTPALLAAALPAGVRGAVVLGTFDRLAAYLEGLPIVAASAPVMALRRLPGDGTRFVLVLATQKEADLPVVATAFAMGRMPWPDREWVTIDELQLPPVGAISEIAASLKPSVDAYPLSALGYTTTTLGGTAPGNTSLRFWSDNWQGRAQIRMHLSYGSGMSPQSALNVLANGSMHGSIPLDRTGGGVYENYTVSLPTGALRPGWNTLELQQVLVPQSNGGDCKPFFPGNLAVTVYDDTTLQTFGGSPLKRPDLSLLMGTARPTPSAPIGHGMAVQLTDGDDATVGAALTLIAKLAQVFDGPLLRSAIVIGAAPAPTNGFWVGSLDRLPEAVRSAVGVDEAGRLKLPVPLIRSVEVPVIGGGDTWRRLREALVDARGGPTIISAQVTLDKAPVIPSLAMTTFDGANALTVFTAGTPAALQAGMHDIVGFGQWAQLRGGLALWRPGNPSVQTVSAEDAPFTAYSLRGGIGLWVSQYPWWALLIMLAVMAALVLMTRIVLAGYRRRHLPLQEGRRREDGVAP